MPEAPIKLHLHSRIADIPVADWDACAMNANPFVSHTFLKAMEDSGSVGQGTGWFPQHATFTDALGQIVAVVSVYVKMHSYGEYVFDHGWADALERAGGAYYPKLQICSPFSPVMGPRLLIRPGAAITQADIGDGLRDMCQKMQLSSAHITFCSEEEWKTLGGKGWLQRVGTQFHWENRNYQTFDDFLATLSSGHRKTIRRERRDANGYGLTFKNLRGHEITPRYWDAFYRFYQATIDRKWGTAYLKRDFFTLLSDRLGDKVLLMIAEYKGEPVAGALNLIGEDTLYGRNWGCEGDWPFLHFELCYYRAIDFAIQQGLKRVEAGAQGAHKIQRGYLPVPTYSAHWIAHQGLSRAVEDFLSQERAAMEIEMENLSTFSPFK